MSKKRNYYLVRMITYYMRFSQGNQFLVRVIMVPLELVADGVKLATYSETDSATSNKSLQNTYIGRSRRAEHEYGIRFSVGQTVSPLKVIKVWRQIWHIVPIESVYSLKFLFINRFTKKQNAYRFSPHQQSAPPRKFCSRS